MNSNPSLWKKIFGEKQKINLDKLNFKDYSHYKLNRFIRFVTNLWYSVIINLAFGIGWFGIAKEVNFTEQWINTIASSTFLFGYGVGHVVVNIVQLLTNKFTSNKVNKNYIRTNQVVGKISPTSIILVVVGLLPLFLYILGYIIVSFKVREYRKSNGNLIREENMGEAILEEAIAQRKKKSGIESITENIVDTIITDATKE